MIDSYIPILRVNTVVPDKLCLVTQPDQGRVVQSVVSLTSLLVVKMLTVLINTICNSQVFLLKKCE